MLLSHNDLMLATLTFMCSGWYFAGMAEDESGSEYFNGKYRSPLNGPFERSIDDLPKYGLVNNSKQSGKLHRPMMGKGSGDWGSDEIVPACVQGEIERQQAGERSYVQDWQVAEIARRLPFAKYGLCRNPGCFRHVELVEEDEDSSVAQVAGD
jgi:hypothetical protein